MDVLQADGRRAEMPLEWLEKRESGVGGEGNGSKTDLTELAVSLWWKFTTLLCF